MAVNLPPMGDLLPIDGISVGAAQAGVKYADRLDLAVLLLDPGTVTGGVFTTSAFAAAPVLLARQRVGSPRALLVNSGNANAATGARGLADARDACAHLAGKLGIDEAAVLPFSTGVIGEFLDMGAMRRGIDAACDAARPQGWADAAHAIMTTDTAPQGGLAYRECRRPADSRHRHGQGLGHDPTGHGDHARVPRHRRRDFGAGRGRADTGSGRTQFQSGHGRWRYVDQRFVRRRGHRSSRHRHRRRRGQSRLCGVARCADAAGGRIGATHGPRRGGCDEVHDGARRTRRGSRRMPRRGVHHRPLAAGQDRGIRQRSELGPVLHGDWPRRRGRPGSERGEPVSG